MECIFINENYRTMEDIKLNINRNNPKFYIDVINILSSKLYNKNNIIDIIDNISDNLNENRISDSFNGKAFSFTKESFQNNYFSISNIFRYERKSKTKEFYGLKLLFEYQILMDKVKDYIRLAKLNNEYFKNYSESNLYQSIQKTQYEELVKSLQIHLSKININFTKEFLNLIYSKYEECKLLYDEDMEKDIKIKRKVDSFLTKNKPQITSKIYELEESFYEIKNEKKNIAVKSESSIIKSINPNNNFIFQLLNS